MQYHDNGYIPHQKPRRSNARIFFKTFFKTLILTLVIMAGGYFSWRHQIRPPQQPPVHAILPLHMVMDTQEANYVSFLTTQTTGPALADPPSEPPQVSLTSWQRREDFYTFLLFGLDVHSNVDTIMVAGFDAEAMRGYLISIPRDTRVDAERSTRRINAAYSAGRRNDGGHEGGVRQLKREVQTLIGFRPDFYISVDMDLVVSIIDILGGVDIYVPFHMRYDDPCQDLFIDIQPGQQTLDGLNALNFARFRQAERGYREINDFVRIGHQQILLNAMLDAAMRPATIPRVPALIRLGLRDDMLSTDLDMRNLIWFAEQVVLARDNFELETYTLPIAGTIWHVWYELPCPQGILEMVNRTVNPFTDDITRNMLRIAQ